MFPNHLKTFATNRINTIQFFYCKATSSSEEEYGRYTLFPVDHFLFVSLESLFCRHQEKWQDMSKQKVRWRRGTAFRLVAHTEIVVCVCAMRRVVVCHKIDIMRFTFFSVHKIQSIPYRVQPKQLKIRKQVYKKGQKTGELSIQDKKEHGADMRNRKVFTFIFISPTCSLYFFGSEPEKKERCFWSVPHKNKKFINAPNVHSFLNCFTCTLSLAFHVCILQKRCILLHLILCTCREKKNLKK